MLTQTQSWNPDKPNVKYSTELKGHTASIEKVAFNPVKDAELCSVSRLDSLSCFEGAKDILDTLTPFKIFPAPQKKQF